MSNHYPLTLDIHFAVKNRAAALEAIAKVYNMMCEYKSGEIERDVDGVADGYEGYVDMKYCNTTDETEG